MPERQTGRIISTYFAPPGTQADVLPGDAAGAAVPETHGQAHRHIR